MVFACSVSAQGPVATQASRSKGATVHQDRVGADYRPLTDLKSKTVFTRTVKLGKHEHYDVVVTDPYGIVRMTGSYRDWSLEVPDGLFTYFLRTANRNQRATSRMVPNWALGNVGKATALPALTVFTTVKTGNRSKFPLVFLKKLQL